MGANSSSQKLDTKGCPIGNPNCFVPSNKCGGCENNLFGSKSLCCHNPLNTKGSDSCFSVSNCNQMPYGPEARHKSGVADPIGGTYEYSKPVHPIVYFIILILLLLLFYLLFEK